MGRALHKPDTPRPIDIDILFYGDQVVETPELVIPHPRLTERAFVLVPLAEIAPADLVHPVSGKTVKELLAEVREKQGVFKWENS
jgi:2-amino-4-hydroxy-6-hydroxymethyldihydropteridine diphosphokinase